MEDQHNHILDWSYFYQGKSPEELTQSLLHTTLELETTRLEAQEELRLRNGQLSQLRDLLNKAINERDEAQNKCHSLLLDNLILHHHSHRRATAAPPHSAISSIEDEHITNGGDGGFSSSDCGESIVSSPTTENPSQLRPPPPQRAEGESTFPVVLTTALPEKGKLLEAVMKAGPLLKNLLLAGPLPLWRHPPPVLDANQIPPPPVLVQTPPPPPPPPATHLPNQDPLLHITNSFDRPNKKRVLPEGSDSSTETKNQRISLNQCEKR